VRPVASRQPPSRATVRPVASRRPQSQAEQLARRPTGSVSAGEHLEGSSPEVDQLGSDSSARGAPGGRPQEQPPVQPALWQRPSCSVEPSCSVQIFLQEQEELGLCLPARE